MKDYTDRSRLHLDTVDKLDYRSRLAGQLDRLHAGTGTLSPAEYDRLLDAYRAEMVRYDHLDRKLVVLESPKRYVNEDLQRKRNEERRAKINY